MGIIICFTMLKSVLVSVHGLVSRKVKEIVKNKAYIAVGLIGPRRTYMSSDHKVNEFCIFIIISSVSFVFLGEHYFLRVTVVPIRQILAQVQLNCDYIFSIQYIK